MLSNRAAYLMSELKQSVETFYTCNKDQRIKAMVHMQYREAAVKDYIVNLEEKERDLRNLEEAISIDYTHLTRADQ